MSRKQNTQRGGKKAKGTGGIGLSKHRSSGVAHNHAVSIARVREIEGKYYPYQVPVPLFQ